MDPLTTKHPKATLVPSAEELYALVKKRVYMKLLEDPYTDPDTGAWVDPVPAKDLGTLTNVILKMRDSERKEALESGQTSKIVPIPSLPPIKREL